MEKIRQCKKQTTVAILMKDGQLISIGTNEIHEDIQECPRKGMATGVGYELCINICKQKSHAEVDACLKAGDKAKGATMYLIGHTYCCDNCLQVMKAYHVKEIKIFKSEFTEDERNDIWEKEKSNRLETMGNSHLWDVSRAKSDFFRGFDAASVVNKNY